MFEFRGLVAGGVAGSSKNAKNENSGKKTVFHSFFCSTLELSMSFLFHHKGFVTPQNKNIFARKALFTDKPKMALGDLKKNSLNVVTPLRNRTVEKVKATPFQHSTPSIKTPKFNRADFSTPKPQRNVIDYTMDDLDVWNQKMLLNEQQFDLLFINPPNIDMVPPAPSPSPPSTPECREYSVHFPTNFDFDSLDDFKHKQEDDYELPPINFDIFTDNF